jgi:ribosomal protein S18 acetylase RimI-like enzyme
VADDVLVERVRAVDDDVVAALNRLLPQLSNGAREVTAQELGEIVEAPGTALLVARVHGAIVGSVTVVVYPIPSGTHAWVEDVVVDAAARGAGVGEALVRAALAEAETLGARTVDLTSSPPREAAIRLYHRVGFRRRETSVFRYTAAGEQASS